MFYHMRLRAFQATGCAILVNGKNDCLIEVRGIDGPIAVVKPGVPFRDPEYTAANWAGHPAWFNGMSSESSHEHDDLRSAQSSSSSDTSSEAGDATHVFPRVL